MKGGQAHSIVRNCLFKGAESGIYIKEGRSFCSGTTFEEQTDVSIDVRSGTAFISECKINNPGTAGIRSQGNAVVRRTEVNGAGEASAVALAGGSLSIIESRLSNGGNLGLNVVKDAERVYLRDTLIEGHMYGVQVLQVNDQAIFHRCIFRKSKEGAMLFPGKSTVLAECRFEDCENSGVTANSTSESESPPAFIQDCTFRRVARGLFIVSGGQLVVRGALFEEFEKCGIEADGEGTSVDVAGVMLRSSSNIGIWIRKGAHAELADVHTQETKSALLIVNATATARSLTVSNAEIGLNVQAADSHFFVENLSLRQCSTSQATQGARLIVVGLDASESRLIADEHAKVRVHGGRMDSPQRAGLLAVRGAEMLAENVTISGGDMALYAKADAKLDAWDCHLAPGPEGESSIGAFHDGLARVRGGSARAGTIAITDNKFEEEDPPHLGFVQLDGVELIGELGPGEQCRLPQTADERARELGLELPGSDAAQNQSGQLQPQASP